MAKLQKGKSKEKNAKPEELEWCYNWCVSVSCYSFNDIISGKARDDREEEDAMSIDDRVKDFASRCRVMLAGSKGRWWGLATTPISPTPNEIIAPQRERFETEVADKARFDAMSKEEQNAEIQGLLGQLKGPGFVMVKI